MSADRLVATRICDATDGDWYCTLDADHDGRHEAHGVGGSLWHTWPRAEPQTWALPAAPGPEVTAVRAHSGRIWHAPLVPTQMWRTYDDDRCVGAEYWERLLTFGPLTDASHPTAAAPAGAAVEPLSQPPTTAPGDGTVTVPP